MEIKGKIVGIDLGTTYSLVAYMDHAAGHPRCIVGPIRLDALSIRR
jgi:molecular chaperone DnaK (HSP70)